MQCQHAKPHKALVGPVPLAWMLIPQQHPARQRVPTPRVWTSGQCRHCSTWFVDRQGQARFCSLACTRKWHRKQRKTSRGNGSGVRLTTRLAVYKRDKGICQLCLKPVDMTLSYRDPWGPTVDHIECRSWSLIPDHSERNLRLAHRMCNSLRGDRPA